MSCLMKFKWVKLPREIISKKKGIMGYWMSLLRVLLLEKAIHFIAGIPMWLIRVNG